MRWIHLLAIVAMLPAMAAAQVFKCTDGAGKTKFSDKACDHGQSSESVRIFASPAPNAPDSTVSPRLSAEAQAHEEKRRQSQAQAEESHRRVDDATAKVTKIRADNFDPQKCKEARARMANMERRDPLTYRFELSYFEYQQFASLHCGN